jgi:exo-beta-1,3-glucanase (GH17 family)
LQFTAATPHGKLPQSKSFGLFTANGQSKQLLPPLKDVDDFTTESGSFGPAYIPGVCWSPFHVAEYPLNGGSSTAGLASAIDTDFKLMRSYFGVVRTYYSSFHGIQVAPIAAANHLKLFLGVYMTRESWYATQINDAIKAAVMYPDTIKAILVGNENVQPHGPFTAQQIINDMNNIRNQIRSQTGGRTALLGSVQRATEWLNPAIRPQMLALAQNSDIIGVNIYPYFDNAYQPSNSLFLLDAIWNQMLALYPAHKLRLTEIGYPTGGAAINNNFPSITNSLQHYRDFLKWVPPGGAPASETFWYSFFDLRPDDRTQPAEIEKHFGFFTHDRKPKVAHYPLTTQQMHTESTIMTTTRAPTTKTTTVTTTVIRPAPPLPTRKLSYRDFRGFNYAPFHLAEYRQDDLANLRRAITKDLNTMLPYGGIVRTAYSNFYGIDIAPLTASVQVDLYLGVYMTREAWYQSQIQSAVRAMSQHPERIRAILVGSENLNLRDNNNINNNAVTYTPSDVVSAIRQIRAAVVTATGRSVSMGTVQRAEDWLHPGRKKEMLALGGACDVIGTYIYIYVCVYVCINITPERTLTSTRVFNRMIFRCHV